MKMQELTTGLSPDISDRETDITFTYKDSDMTSEVTSSKSRKYVSLLEYLTGRPN